MSREDVMIGLYLILAYLLLLWFAPLILADCVFVVGLTFMVWRVFLREVA